MTVLRVLCVVILSIGIAHGTPEKHPPEPARLAADWWTYFSAEPLNETDTLSRRIATSSDYLTTLKKELSAEQRDKFAPVIDAITRGLQRYAQSRALTIAATEPAPPPLDSYTLAQFLQVIDKLRRAQLEHSGEGQEIALLEEAIKTSEREQSRKKVAYLELDALAPQRTEQGLQLMQSRIQLERARLELQWRKAQRKQLAKTIERYEAERTIAAERLSADSKDVQAWKDTERQAQARAQDIKDRLLKTQLNESNGLASTPIEKARDQLQTQRINELEAQLTEQQLSVSRAQITQRLLTRVIDHNKTQAEADRKQLDAYQEQVTELRQKLTAWQQVNRRERENAGEQLANENKPAIIAVHKERLLAADGFGRQLHRLEEQVNESAQLGEVLDALLQQREGRVGRGLQLTYTAIGGSWQTLNSLMSTSLFEISETPVTATGLLRVVLIITLAWWISKLLRRALRRLAEKRATVNQSSVYTLGRMLHYVILAVGILIGLSSIGIDFTKFALFASALGVGIGFGLQNLVSNFVAGLIILFEKSLKVGDYVELESGVTGEVKEINMRSTLITTNDNVDIVVPNSEFVNGRVINWTMREVHRRIHIPFGVAYGSDKERVKEAVLQAAHAVPWTLKNIKSRLPQVWLVQFGDSSLNFELIVWLTSDAVKRPGAVQAAYLWEIESKLHEHGIEIPFPQRDLHLRSVFGKRDESAWDRFTPDDDNPATS